MKRKTLLLLFALMLTSWSQAQISLTVCDGTATNGYIPIYGYYADAYNRSQFVYPSSDLVPMSGCMVNSMTFYLNQATIDFGLASWNVYLTEVASTSISSFIDVSTATQVYSGAVSISNNQMTITFTTPYTYTSGNLLVGFDQPVTGTYVTTTWQGVTANNASISGYSYSSMASITAGQKSFLPKVTFDYNSADPNYCFLPLNVAVSGIDTTSAIISWNTGGSETAWNLKWGVEGFSPDSTGMGTLVANLTDSTYTFNNVLSSGTKYDVYVQSICSDTSFSLWKKVSFKTLTVPATVPYYTDFSTADNGQWEYSTDPTSNVFFLGTDTLGQACYTPGGALFISNNGGNTNTYNLSSTTTTYVYRVFDSIPAGNYVISYRWKCAGEGTSDFGRAFLFPADQSVPAIYYNTEPYSWIALDGATSLSGQSEWQLCNAEFSITTPGAYKLMFYWKNNSYSGTQPPLAIDDLSFTVLTCPAPTNFVAATNAIGSADLSWHEVASASAWEIEYGLKNFVQGNGVVVNSTDTIYTLTGLADNSLYDVYVRAICGAADTSNWTKTSFKTICGLDTQLPLVEDFENSPYSSYSSSAAEALPDCWNRICTTLSTMSNYTNNPYVHYESSNASNGYNSLRFYVENNSNYGDEYAVLPPIQYNGDMIFTFNAKCYSYGMLELGSMSNLDSIDFVPFDTLYLTTTYQHFNIYVSNIPDPNNYIAFRVAKLSDHSINCVYLDELTVDAAPTCVAPHNFVSTMATQTEVSLAWECFSNPLNYQVEYGMNGFAQGTGTIVMADTSMTATITGLATGMPYDFYVRAICSETDSSAWTGPVTVTPGEVIIGEGTYGSSTAGFCNCYRHSWSQSIYTAQEMASSGMITTLSFDCSVPQTNIFFDTIRIYVAETAHNTNASWVPMSDLTMVYEGIGINNLGTTLGWNTIQLDEPFYYSGSENLAVIIAKSMTTYNCSVYWKYNNASLYSYRQTDGDATYAQHPGTSTPSTGNYRPNIKIALTSAAGYCSKPGKIEMSNIEIFSARANWQVGNEESVWNLKYGTAGFDVETSGTLVNDIDTIFYDITGLTDSTTYDVYVQSQCTDSTVSGWKGPVTFTTLPMCTAPTNFRFAGMNESSVTLAWTPGYTETLWEIEYDTTGFVQGTGIVITDSLTQHQITGLVSGGTYDFYIRSICNAGMQSIWVGPITQTIGEITIGNGQQSYSYLPFYGFYGYTYSQQLFDANEMAGACMITQVKFYCVSLPSGSTGAVKIWMGNTDKNVFANNTDYVEPSELNLVYDMGVGVAWSSLHVGWNTIVLDEPFVYDGSSNLVVAYYEGMAGYSSSSFYAHTTTAHKSLLHYSDSQSSVSYTSPATGTGSIEFDYKRNDIKFVVQPIDPNFCFMPIHFVATEKTSTSFGVSWAPMDTTFAGPWNLKWGIHGFDVDTAGILVAGLDSTSYFMDNLQTNTVYDVYVQTVCSDSSSSDWRGPLMVRTLCGTTTGVPFVENFDLWPAASSPQTNNLPDCWDYLNNGSYYYYAGYPIISSNSPYTPLNSLYFSSGSYSDYGDQYAILPPFDSISDLQIQFYGKRASSSYTTYDGILVIGIMDSVSESAFVPYDTINLTETYEKYTIYLSQYIGTGNRIALKAPHINAIYNTFYLDDIIVDTIPSCPPVSNIAVVTVDTASATLTWAENGDATAWEIEYGAVGYTQGAGTVVAADSIPFTITGLTPCTGYDVYVRAACGSAWEGPRRFYTSQIPADMPFSCGFEANETETTKWTLENGEMTNQWWIGSDYYNFGHCSGTQGLYLSYDGGQTNYYTNQNTAIYAYRTFDLEAGTYVASFKWIAKGDGTNDYIRAFLVPAGVTLTAGQNYGITSTNTPDGWIAIGGALQDQATWQSYFNENLLVETAGFYNLVFCWINDTYTSEYPAPAIDNVQLFAMTCAAPTALQCTLADVSSATITWTDEATPTSWNIEYGVKGFAQGSGTVVTATTKPYILTNLQATTQYDVYVQANCGEEDGLSGWAGPLTITTSSCVESDMCPITIKLFDQVYDGWMGNAIDVYAVNGASEIFVHSYTMGSGTNAVVHQAQLCPGTLSFRWKVGAFPNECSFILLTQEGDTIYSCVDGSTLQDGAEFLSYEHSCGNEGCPAPSGLVASLGAVTYNNAVVDLTWTATEEALTYNVLRDGIPVATALTTTTYTDNVNANGNYVYTVTASCAEGLESNPSNQSTIMVTGVGIGENAAEQARLYPNPTNDKVKVEAAEMTRISVMNVIGQILYEEEVDTDAYEFDFAGYEAGVYMMRIETTTGNATKRVTVVK